MSAALLLVAIAAPRVFVDAADAEALRRSGAVVLDARDDPQAPFVAGARPIDWSDLRDGWGRTGRLAPLSKLEAALSRLGVERDRPVIVYGAAHRGWGEEGRIWWTLRYLGHPEVYILDGGIDAWRAARLPVAGRAADPPHRKANFISHPKDRLRADADEVARAARHPQVELLDARRPEEYAGATPYWSARGGHVPTAVSLPWKDLLRPDGRLRSRADLRARLAQLGLAPGDRAIAYCTGGVRSAFMVAVLTELGVDAANYDGSWWDWSADQERPVEGAE